jgi:hypothetical protein
MLTCTTEFNAEADVHQTSASCQEAKFRAHMRNAAAETKPWACSLALLRCLEPVVIERIVRRHAIVGVNPHSQEFSGQG